MTIASVDTLIAELLQNRSSVKAEAAICIINDFVAALQAIVAGTGGGPPAAGVVGSDGTNFIKITIGTNLNYSAPTLSTVNNPTFSTSVTTPIILSGSNGGSVTLAGGGASNNGGIIQLFGSTNANANQIRLLNGVTVVAQTDNSGNFWAGGSTAGAGAEVLFGATNTNWVKLSGSAGSGAKVDTNAGNLILSAAGTTVATFTTGGELKTNGGATPIIGVLASANDGSGAQVGTLTNAPAAGNPTKWVAFDDAGTTRFIPTW